MTFEKRPDAEGWLVDERRALERDTRGIAPWTPPSAREAERWELGETLGDYGRTWIAERKVKPRTREHYESQFGLHIDPALGDSPIRQVTNERVRRWYAALGTDHPSRNAQVYGLLHSIMNTAVTDGIVAANPCTITGALVPTRKREPIILDVAEIGALADEMPTQYRALVLVAAWCGLRWGEVTELRRKDVSADGSVVTVARGVTRRSGVTRVDTPKSGKVRVVVVPPHIRADIVTHLAVHTGPGAEALLFESNGKHLDDRTFAVTYKAALTAIGRDGVTFHMLRHFGGTQAARVGGTVAETMRRLGHSTVAASMAYQAAVDQRDVEIADRLSKLAEDAQN